MYFAETRQDAYGSGITFFGKSKTDLESLYIAEKKLGKLIIKIIILTLKLITTLL
jgi:hypothetical protein